MSMLQNSQVSNLLKVADKIGRKPSNDGNRWLKDRELFEEDILTMSDEATIIFENSGELIKNLKTFLNSMGENEKKHPYGKAAVAVRTYASGMRNSSTAFTHAGTTFDKMYEACVKMKEYINGAVLGKLISFKDVECKDIDQVLTSLRKAQKDYAIKKSKKNPDMVQVDAAESTLKKLNEEAKAMLTKFNKTGCEILTQLSDEMKNGFDVYCEAGSSL